MSSFFASMPSRNFAVPHDLQVHKHTEMSKNCFTPFYSQNNQGKNTEPGKLSDVERELRWYRHSDGIDFAAMSWSWTSKEAPTTTGLRKPDSIVPTISYQDGLRAFYRVMRETDDTYTLMACHYNVHGLHRGDLRFVEVNDRTEIQGSDYSPVGRLFLGDVVAVTELAPTEYMEMPLVPVPVSRLTTESCCVWMVRHMTVLTRKFIKNAEFALMEEDNVVVNGHGERCRVKEAVEEDQIYVGDVFIPVKLNTYFTCDHNTNRESDLLSVASVIPTFAEPKGTVCNFKASEKHTEMFAIGTDAFQHHQEKDAAEIVEFCSLIGYSATRAVLNSHGDSRQYTMIGTEHTGQLVRFRIDNPRTFPALELWHTNGRITISGARISVNAVIDTIVCEGGHLRIIAHLTRDVSSDLNLNSGIFTVQQRQIPEEAILQKDFFKSMPGGSNGKRIIETLYGGESIVNNVVVEEKQYSFPSTPPIQLNEAQCAYVSQVLLKSPMVVANSPFGCGKSMTLATAALYWFRAQRAAESRTPQLLITQSNFASVNLVEMALKTRRNVGDVRILRYVSEANWREIIDQYRTELDMPALMPGVLKKWATEEQPVDNVHLEKKDVLLVLNYLMHMLKVPQKDLNSRVRYLAGEASRGKRVWPSKLIEPFLKIYQPDIIIITANSLPGLLTKVKYLPISLVQMDEASLLPECTLFAVLSRLPNACFGITGDIKQLAPYCEEELTGRLKDYGVGNAMERAVRQNFFPQVNLNVVYRCHRVTTRLLGELFYNNELIAEVDDKQKKKFMVANPQFWPNPEFPILVINNPSEAMAMGNSFGNTTELEIAVKLVDLMMGEQCGVHWEDIGVLSFYSAQRSLLGNQLSETGVKCGTVDSFQGCEKEIVVVCCTSHNEHEFLRMKNRMNVAMSRSKQVTIVIGNVEMLNKIDCWNTVVQRAAQNGSLVDMNKFQFGQIDEELAEMTKELNEKLNLDSNRTGR